MKYLAGLFATFFVAAMIHGQFTQAPEIPAYHAAPPAKGALLPAVMTEQQLAASGFTLPAQKESYKAAARIGSVLYQQPCFCHCDRHAGHTSLRSCFENAHGANCSTCMSEALYAYQKSKAGWSPKMIRDSIIRQEFQHIDLQNPTPVM